MMKMSKPVSALPAGQRSALDKSLAAVCALASRALQQPVALNGLPPLGRAPYAYGDLVPLGFVLLALECAARACESESVALLAEAVRQHLLARRTRQLWAYHTGGLETSIDSGLILLAIQEPDAIGQLERFNIGGGQYLPQLSTAGLEPGKMTVRDSLAHWCQPDYSIACLVRALRKQSGLPITTSLDQLKAGFASRSGLYLANPYWTDWLLAMALKDEDEAAPLRARLGKEVWTSASADGLFGKYDQALSTALALLTLHELGADDSLAGPSAFALAELVENGKAIPACPFYSTEQIAWSKLPPWELMNLLLTEAGQQLIRCNQQEHAITFYQDVAGLVVYPLSILALLAVPSAPSMARPGESESPDGRYSCATAADYIAGYALPPYLPLTAAPL